MRLCVLPAGVNPMFVLLFAALRAAFQEVDEEEQEAIDSTLVPSLVNQLLGKQAIKNNNVFTHNTTKNGKWDIWCKAVCVFDYFGNRIPEIYG